MGKQSKVESGAQPEVVPATRPKVDVTGAKEALTIGPKEVLVMTLPTDYADQVEELRQTFMAVLGPNRFVLVFADDVQMAAVTDVAAAGEGRPYVQPVKDA